MPRQLTYLRLCCADDIPIQDEVETTLDSITEEQEEAEKGKTKSTPVGALKHLQKLPGLSKKHKTKSNPSNEPQQIELANAGDQGNVVVESPPGDTAVSVV